MSSHDQLSKKIIEKALQHSDFMSKLKSDPKSAIKESIGVDIPDTININVLEEKADEFFLVLPQASKSESQLSEDELDTVSGGWSGGVNDNGGITCGAALCSD